MEMSVEETLGRILGYLADVKHLKQTEHLPKTYYSKASKQLTINRRTLCPRSRPP